MKNKAKKHLSTCLALGLAVGMTGIAFGAADNGKATTKPYPLDTCVVSGKKLELTSSTLYSFNYKGQQITMCCQGCREDFQKAPAKYMAKVTAAAKLVKPYPLKTCVVSGETLGEMGNPYVFVFHGQELKLCCKGCLKTFSKEPEKYLAKMRESKSSH